MLHVLYNLFIRKCVLTSFKNNPNWRFYHLFIHYGKSQNSFAYLHNICAGEIFSYAAFCFLFTYLWADSSIRLVYFSLLRCTFWVILHSFQSSDNLDASESNANVIKWDKHHESKDIIMDLRLRNIYICLTAHTNGK